MKKSAKGIGLAIIGGGRVGLFRGEVAARHPSVEWIGLAEKNPNRAGEVAPKISADFVTQSHVELLKRPEVTCAIIATDEHLHVDPIMVAVERGIPLLIEKPLATNLAESARVLKAIKDAKVDAVVGYTQRFRRRWLAAKEKCRTGALGDVTLVTSRAFMNRLVAIDNYKRTDDPATISPMVISGTHALDICMWCLDGKKPVEVYARSIDKVLGPLYKGIDATAGMIMFDDGTVYHLNISWALPVTWPGAVYSLEVGIVGTTGVLTIDDTHRDIVLAVSKAQSEGYNPDATRLVDFMGSYPPGDMALGELRGPMAEETDSWLNRVALGLPTAAATVEEAHRNLMLTKALDLSAKRKQPVKLPLDPERDTGGGVNRQREDGMTAANGLRGALLGLLALVAATRLCAAEDAASYPTRPIHIIVPFAPGGASDFAIRLIQPAMEKALGQTLVIDNRTGAAGNVGMETAARAAPDGYTLFLGNIGTIAINPHFFPDLDGEAGARFHTHFAGRRNARHRGRQRKISAELAQGHDRLCQGEPRQDQLCRGRRQHAQHPGDGAVPPPARPADDAGALQRRRRSRDHRSAGRQRRRDVRHAVIGGAVREGRQIEGLCRHHDGARGIAARRADRGRTRLPRGRQRLLAGPVRGGRNAAPIVAKLHAAVLKAMADPDVRQHMIAASMVPTSSPTPESFKNFVVAELAKWKTVVEQIKAAEKSKSH